MVMMLILSINIGHRPMAFEKISGRPNAIETSIILIPYFLILFNFILILSFQNASNDILITNARITARLWVDLKVS